MITPNNILLFRFVNLSLLLSVKLSKVNNENVKMSFSFMISVYVMHQCIKYYREQSRILAFF